MNDLRSQLQGLWLPLMTPFQGGGLDEVSLRQLVWHYGATPIDGLILAATSGEGLSLSIPELDRLSLMRRLRSGQAFLSPCMTIANVPAYDSATGWRKPHPCGGATRQG